MIKEQPLGQESKILSVATRLFAEKGFANVSVRDICREARASLPTVYYYFRNKRGLFDAVVRKTISLEGFTSQLDAATAGKRGAAAKCRALVATYLTSFPEQLVNVGLYIRDSAHLDQLSTKQFIAGLDNIHSKIRGLLEEGVREGSFRKTDTGRAADCLLGMMNRFVFQRAHFQRRFNSGDVAPYVSDFFLRAMQL